MAVYYHLEENIQWEDGIRSRSGFTRKANPMYPGMDPILDNCIIKVLSTINNTQSQIYGIYLNYYRNGEDWTPNHSHPGMKQIVISLGADRILTMASNRYNMSNGDVIVFGSSIHGVPSAYEVKIQIVKQDAYLLLCF